MSDEPTPVTPANDNPSPLLQRLDALDEQRAARTARKRWLSHRVVRRLLLAQRPELRRRRPF